MHYHNEMLGQAAKVLGSVDFLGNPLGLFSDMAEGVQCLLEGSVGGLLKNVTKGATNSVAKVTLTLSLSLFLSLCFSDFFDLKKKYFICYF